MDVFDNGEETGGVSDGSSGGTVGGDVRGVQLVGHCKHDVVVSDNREKAGGVDDGYSVVVCDNGKKTGGSEDGSAGGTVGYDLRGVQLVGSCKHTGPCVFFQCIFKLCTATVSPP